MVVHGQLVEDFFTMNQNLKQFLRDGACGGEGRG